MSALYTQVEKAEQDKQGAVIRAQGEVRAASAHFDIPSFSSDGRREAPSCRARPMLCSQHKG